MFVNFGKLIKSKKYIYICCIQVFSCSTCALWNESILLSVCLQCPMLSFSIVNQQKMFQCIYMIPSSSPIGLSNNSGAFSWLLFRIDLFLFRLNCFCLWSEFWFWLPLYHSVRIIPVDFIAHISHEFDSSLRSLINPWLALSYHLRERLEGLHRVM